MLRRPSVRSQFVAIAAIPTLDRGHVNVQRHRRSRTVCFAMTSLHSAFAMTPAHRRLGFRELSADRSAIALERSGAHRMRAVQSLSLLPLPPVASLSPVVCSFVLVHGVHRSRKGGVGGCEWSGESRADQLCRPHTWSAWSARGNCGATQRCAQPATRDAWTRRNAKGKATSDRLRSSGQCALRDRLRLRSLCCVAHVTLCVALVWV